MYDAGPFVLALNSVSIPNSTIVGLLEGRLIAFLLLQGNCFSFHIYSTLKNMDVIA